MIKQEQLYQFSINTMVWGPILLSWWMAYLYDTDTDDDD